jgi:hypothetical protein
MTVDPSKQYQLSKMTPKGRRSRSQTRIKSSKYVNYSSDEAREEEALSEEAGERGRSRVKKEDVKGKQKDTAEDYQESGTKEIGNTEAPQEHHSPRQQRQNQA